MGTFWFLKKCVEHYDSVKDPIKYYFLEKIQMALVNKSSLNLMASKENIKKPIKRKAYKKKVRIFYFFI